MKNSTYKELALKDLEYAKAMKDIKHWNPCARFCEQYVEKMLKEIIDHHAKEEDYQLMFSHNVPKLAKRVEEILNQKYAKTDIIWFRRLKDFYFNTNYPGDSYEEIEEEEIKDLFIWLEHITPILLLQQEDINK